MSKNKLSILLFLCIIFFISSWLLLTNITLKNEYATKDMDVFTRIYISHQFNYLNGLWLIPTGLMFVTFLLILDFPSYEEIYKKLKKDLKIKIYKDTYRHGKD